MIHRIHGKPPVPESKFEKAQREARVTQPTTDREVDARHRGYREGRAAVWQELAEYIDENLTIADREVALSDGPLPTADEVRGIYRADRPPEPPSGDVERLARAIAAWWVADRPLIPFGASMDSWEVHLDDARLIAEKYAEDAR